MGEDERGADLHLHTTASDGTCSVADRIEQARTNGLNAIAITDHDNIASTLTDRTTTRGGVEVITGAEIRADVRGTKVELLGYFIDPSAPELQTLLGRAREFRHRRNRKLVAVLNETVGVDFDYEEIRRESTSPVGRPYFADRLVEAGVVEDKASAFDEYLGDGTECFVPMERLGYREVIDAVHSAGGVTSLAHPGRIRADTETVEAIVSTLAGAGLDAIEVGYPYGSVRSSAYASVDAADAAAMASQHGLHETSGSDCHGPGSGKYRIGEKTVAPKELEALRSKASGYQ